jgi:hypothetical protein
MKFLAYTVISAEPNPIMLSYHMKMIDNAKPYQVSFRKMLQIRFWSLSDVCYTAPDWLRVVGFSPDKDYISPTYRISLTGPECRKKCHSRVPSSLSLIRSYRAMMAFLFWS